MASRAFDPGREPNGRWQQRPALERFAEKCRFEPETGCVVWIGGTSSGQLKTALYPVFWDDGRRWFGHRWAAKNIHGIDIDGFEVDHCCPLPRPNTLCVHHVQAVTKLRNLELQWGRRLWGWDDWEPEPEPDSDPALAVPFHLPPAWLRPFLPPSPMEPF